MKEGILFCLSEKKLNWFSNLESDTCWFKIIICD